MLSCLELWSLWLPKAKILTMMGLEPTFSDPKSDALPLSYTAWYVSLRKHWPVSNQNGPLYNQTTDLLATKWRSTESGQTFQQTCMLWIILVDVFIVWDNSNIFIFLDDYIIFSSNLWMWDPGMPKGTILHQLPVSKVRISFKVYWSQFGV